MGFIDNKLLTKYDSYPEDYTIMDPAWTYDAITSISDMWRKDNSLFIELGLDNIEKSILEITNIENRNTFKISYNRLKPDIDGYKDYIKEYNTILPEYKDNGDKYTVELNDNFSIDLFKYPFNMVLRKDQEVVFELYHREGYQVFNGFASIPLGFKKIDDYNSNPIISFKAKSNEIFYGQGEKFNGVVRNGKKSTIWNTDNSCVANQDISYMGLPLIFSNQGYGVLVETGEKTYFDVTSKYTDAFAIETTATQLDMYIFYGRSLKSLITEYTKLTGTIKGVPTFAYGTWISRLYFYTNDEVTTELKKAQDVEFPVDVVNIDPKWIKDRVTKSCNFDYNDDQFGPLNSFVEEIKQFDNQTSLCLWVNPYIQIDSSDTFKEAEENNYLLKMPDGDLAHAYTGTEVYQAKTAIVDFSNPEANEWWKAKIKTLIKDGVKVIKPDYGDGVPVEAIFANGLTGAEMKQHFETLYVKAAYEAIEEVNGEGKAMVYRRPGYIGAHQYAGKWGGDSRTTFEEMLANIKAGISATLCGEIMWGHDIGGFAQDFVHSGASDLFVRWSQFGAFTTLTRWHGMGAREPWNLAANNLDAIKKYIKIKRQFIPYYKVLEQEAINFGTPIMRALALEFENDNIANKIEDQFLVGSNVLVSPVYVNKAKNRDVYLPEGQWYDIETTDIYEGRQNIVYDTPIDVMPVFIKMDSYLVLFKEERKSLNDTDETLDLVVRIYGEVEDTEVKFELLGQDISFDIKDNKLTNVNGANIELEKIV